MGQYDFDTRYTGDNVAEEKAIVHNNFLMNVILKTIMYRVAIGEIGAEERDM